MYARTTTAVLVLFVLLSSCGRGPRSQPRTASAVAGDSSTPAAAAPGGTKAFDSPESASAGAERVYEVHKRVLDFPDREDLSTPEAAYATIRRAMVGEGIAAARRFSVPEIAARIPAGSIPRLPKEYAEGLLNAEIIEVHVWDETHAEVIAKMKDYGPKPDQLDRCSLERVKGQWLNRGDELYGTLAEARKSVADVRRYEMARRLHANGPAVADPAAHLQPFVDFLKHEAKDPQQFVLDAIGKHRVVIMGEIHHRPRYWAFDAALVRSPEFARRVGVIYLELPSNDQPLVDRFLADAKYDPEPVIEMLRDNLWMGWPDQPMLDFFRTVWEVNRKLAESQRLRIVLADMARPWKQIRKRDDWRKYEVDRDQYMAENILRDLEKHAADKRHALFIVGYAHAMLNLTWAGGAPMKSAGWHLREKLRETNVFAVFPHGPVITNGGQVSGRLARGLFDTAFAAMGNKPMAFPLDRGPFGKQIFDADPERLTRDPYGKGYHAYLYLGPLEDEVFSPLIPGFYSDEFVRELDRRWRIMEGKGLVAAGLVKRLDGASFAAWMGRNWGQPRPEWSADQLGPLEAWRYGSHFRDAMRKRLPSTQATTGKVMELYDIRSGRESLANLANGTVMAPDLRRFRGDNPQGRAWLKEKGIDLLAYAQSDAGDQGVAGYDMVVAKIDNNRFDAFGLTDTQRALEKVEEEATTAPATMMSIKAGLPVTYAIRTRAGSVGVLQIEDARISETPAVFRLRYKLFTKP